MSPLPARLKTALEHYAARLPLVIQKASRRSLFFRGAVGRLLACIALMYFSTVISLYLFSDELYILPTKSRLQASSSLSSSINNQLSSWTPAGEEFDPFGAPAYLLQPGNSETYRFAWRDWMDLHTVQDVETVMSFCKERNVSSIHELKFPVKDKMPVELCKISGRIYLDNFAVPPSQVIFIGKPEASVQFHQGKQRPRPLNKVDQQSQPNDVNNPAIYKLDAYTVTDDQGELFIVPPPPPDNTDLSHLKSFIPQSNNSKSLNHQIDLELSPDLFRINAYEMMFPSTSKDNMDKDIPLNNEVAYHAAKFREWNIDLAHSPKYFDEIYLDGNRWEGDHYDWRFFTGLRNEVEHQAIMHHLIRAWGQFTAQEQIISWIAHGSLLGWYWNGMAMPWDSDNDVQMPIKELDRIARVYNQTLVVQDPEEGSGRYLLDVSSLYVQRDKGNGQNVIDARFIDTRSGIYLDITGLAETPEHPGKVHCKNYHFYKVDQLSPLRKTMYEGVPVYVPKNYELVLQQEYKTFRQPHFDDWDFSPAMHMWVRHKKCAKFNQASKQFDSNRKLTFYGACEDEAIWREYNVTHQVTELHANEMDAALHLEAFGNSVSNDDLEVYEELDRLLSTEVPPFRVDVD